MKKLVSNILIPQETVPSPCMAMSMMIWRKGWGATSRSQTYSME